MVTTFSFPLSSPSPFRTLAQELLTTSVVMVTKEAPLSFTTVQVYFLLSFSFSQSYYLGGKSNISLGWDNQSHNEPKQTHQQQQYQQQSYQPSNQGYQPSNNQRYDNKYSNARPDLYGKSAPFATEDNTSKTSVKVILKENSRYLSLYLGSSCSWWSKQLQFGK